MWFVCYPYGIPLDKMSVSKVNVPICQIGEYENQWKQQMKPNEIKIEQNIYQKSMKIEAWRGSGRLVAPKPVLGGIWGGP